MAADASEAWMTTLGAIFGAIVTAVAGQIRKAKGKRVTAAMTPAQPTAVKSLCQVHSEDLVALKTEQANTRGDVTALWAAHKETQAMLQGMVMKVAASSNKLDVILDAINSMKGG